MDHNSWVKLPAPNPQARLRLFCFPYAGGAASIFHNWPDHVVSSVEICSVQLPGREERLGECAFTNLAHMVKTLGVVLSSYMDRPFAFYGHSMGSLIAFELARELRRQNRPGPVHLFVSGRCAPHVPDPDPQLHQLADAEFIEGIRGYNGTPEEVFQNKQLMDLLLPLLRADFEVCESYNCRDEAPLACGISAYAGKHEYARDLIPDWAAQTTGQFETMILPGDHFFLNTERARFVDAISSRLLQYLTEGDASFEVRRSGESVG